MFSRQSADHKPNAKKVPEADDGRKRREDARVTLRHKHREEALLKKRATGQGSVPTAMSGGEGPISIAGALPVDQVGGATTEEILRMMVHLPELTERLCGNDPTGQLHAATCFRRLLALESNPPLTEIIGCGVIPRFIEFLTHPKAQLQFEATWALTNIASGDSQHTRAVVEAGAIPHFIRLLSASAEELREQAVWALGNIAGDNAKFRDMVLDAGALQPLMNMLTAGPKLSVMKNAAWALSNLYRSKPAPSIEKTLPALDVIRTLLNHDDAEVIVDGCWAVSYFSDASGGRIALLIKHGFVPKLVELLNYNCNSIQAPILRTLGNICTGSEDQVQIVVESGVLQLYPLLLQHPSKSIRRESCWSLSNILAGTQAQIQAVINAQLIPALLELMRTAEFEVKREALWCIANATTDGSTEQICYLVQQGAIQSLVDMMAVTDPKVARVALEALHQILIVGKDNKHFTNGLNVFAKMFIDAGGDGVLEGLQNVDDSGLYERAYQFFQCFFADEGSQDNSIDSNGAVLSSTSSALSFE